MIAPLRAVLPGRLQASVLKLEAPISFWGGIDFQTGRIVDRSHPQAGQLVCGSCLVVPMIRGSGGTPGSLAMLLKLGLGPAGIVIGYPDINVLAGLVVAERLYGQHCPMFVATEAQLHDFVIKTTVTIEPCGSFKLHGAD